MKITYNWLKELVRFNYTPHELAEQLTMLGLEVELVIPVKPSFSKIIVGKILEIKPHPNAGKLLICKVTTGTEILQIICGAHNISTGDLVPAAINGSMLADNTEITVKNILGVESFGMLCSEKELGLNDISNGILILSNENTNCKTLKIGAPLEKELGLEDTILDINVTPNRPDALSMIGIAREISCITGNPVKFPKIYFVEDKAYTKENIIVKLKAGKLCPRYTARVIKNLKIKASPFWLRYRLGLLGLRPVNNVVDITNLVMLELGQPLHAFDYKKIENAVIIIRQGNEEEKILTIDNESRILDKDVLVIASDKKPIAIAGVMGGKETEVTSNTTDILLESAYFEPTSIRRTSKKYGLTSESSYRFERATDPQLPPAASNRAVQLILKTAGGIALKGIVDYKKDIPKPPLIKLEQSFCSRIIGIDIPFPKIESIFKGLQCSVKKQRNTFFVKPPSWRRDITNRIDLIEEITRIFGYIKIPSLMPIAKVKAPAIDLLTKITNKIYHLLTGMGLNEIITYSFINQKDIPILNIPIQKYTRLVNPVDKDVCAMRPSLIPGIINTIVYNFNMGNDSVHIFEIGRCFMPDEKLRLGIGISGSINNLHWQKKGITPDFYYLKGIIEELFYNLNLFPAFSYKKGAETFHPGKVCKISVSPSPDNGRVDVGIFGELHPQITAKLDIKDPSRQIYLAEIELTSLLGLITGKRKFQTLSKFPSIRRDISIILDSKLESYDIIRIIREMDLDIIESVDIFDVYSGHPIPEGKKSIAYAITYRHKERTLTDEEVENIHSTIRHKILEHVPNADIRE